MSPSEQRRESSAKRRGAERVPFLPLGGGLIGSRGSVRTMGHGRDCVTRVEVRSKGGNEQRAGGTQDGQTNGGLEKEGRERCASRGQMEVSREKSRQVETGPLLGFKRERTEVAPFHGMLNAQAQGAARWMGSRRRT